jgi:hypothetical protein
MMNCDTDSGLLILPALRATLGEKVLLELLDASAVRFSRIKGAIAAGSPGLLPFTIRRPDGQTAPFGAELDWTIRWASADFAQATDCISEAYGSGHADTVNPAHGYHLLRAREALEENHRVPAAADERPGRNAPCSCGSGKKYKRCCG